MSLVNAADSPSDGTSHSAKPKFYDVLVLDIHLSEVKQRTHQLAEFAARGKSGIVTCENRGISTGGEEDGQGLYNNRPHATTLGRGQGRHTAHWIDA